ncbi:hypothetical protein [Sulfurovum sp.]|uniref:hypothetical protein n=1 Tax=Sulfurovum sp. TaxID=1969726 RepID=UPI002867F42C|nr:hypothetical protein [Sulfurovum sp.]
MRVLKYIQTFLLTSCMGTMMLYADVKTHFYEIERGIVYFDIRGSAQLTPETNLTIEGIAKLGFKDWGNLKLEEEEGIVLTTGAIKHKQHVQRFEKRTADSIITADFENEQLLSRKKNKIAKDLTKETDGLLHKGSESVAGVMCDIWIGPGIKKCIYKGIVLKLESHYLDVSYERVARKIYFDINISKDTCKLPDYPIQAFGLFTDNIKTKNANKTENFCSVLKNAVFDISDEKVRRVSQKINDKERKKFINRIGKDIFKKQQVLLPELLTELKETRQCLYTVENPFEANQCIEQFSRMKEKLGTREDDFIILWDDKRKSKLIDIIEDEVIYLESRISCVKRSKNITDLSQCMK